MKRYLKYCFAVLGAVILFLPDIFAQEANKDQDFLTKAVSSNQFEIALGTQALKQTENEEIKQYGRMLINDHTKVLEELQEAAMAKKLVMPDGMEEDQASILKSLSVLSGADFDNAFKDIAIKTHENTIALFENAASNLNDQEFRSWAAEKVPSLRSHLEQAKALQIKSGSDISSPSENRDSVETL
ncbi:DUF4142 domain-containing protein [Sphingobacterium chuzhouense]|uniref:DUF4142 domain-containing protein n=1 Tax=Sphingobacterium chuzhouense TaxID=1742264 RepID=A0ABR7XVW4_9SPHI|nr:DUF4142 domain-containing protein [Sphingobacterium chuzhouense]MBD1423182.1 DUF4142 domain-containing protein [Sphingobacterium chuzhouense]